MFKCIAIHVERIHQGLCPVCTQQGRVTAVAVVRVVGWSCFYGISFCFPPPSDPPTSETFLNFNDNKFQSKLITLFWKHMHTIANQTFSYVNNCNLNKSKTKETHAFSKSSRFEKTKQSQCMRHSYNLSSSMVALSKNGRSPNSKFGKQSRFKMQDQQLSRKSLSPSPLQYQLAGFTQQNKNKKQGSAFGKDKKMPFNTNDVPGVGKYKAQVYNPETNLSYSMRTKPKKDPTHWNKVGPGQYEAKNSLQPNGTYHVSKYSNSKCGKIGKSKRFQGVESDTPGAGTYAIEKMRTEPSQFGNSGVYSFGKAKRRGDRAKDTPGPGAYTQFSQFSESSQKIIESLMKM